MSEFLPPIKSFLIRRQKLIERLVASSVILYSFGAAILVWKGLSKYGVNPIFFFIIDVCTSWPYGIATARIVVKVLQKEWKEVRKWSWVAAITFVTPQIYVLATARHVPKDVYLIVYAVIGCLIVFAILSLTLQIRSSKKSLPPSNAE
jgi:predicted neutral ceramidase superfamily lipid hydrolase